MRLKLLSWNIWCDGHFDDIKQFLLSADADILCLQEVLPRSKTIPVVELLTARGYVHAYGAAMEITLSSGENEDQALVDLGLYRWHVHHANGGRSL